MHPFPALYYKQVVLTGAQMGLLTSPGWAISMPAAPVWGRWGDTAKQPKVVLPARLLASFFLGVRFCLQRRGRFEAVITS